MSSRMVDLAFGLPNSEVTATEKFVLVAMAEHHNEQTGRCDPGLDRLAERTGLERRTVIRSIVSMEQKKIIGVVRRRGQSNNYDLSPVTESHPCQTVTGDNNDQKGCHRVTRGVTLTTKRGDSVSPEPEGTGIEPEGNQPPRARTRDAGLVPKNDKPAASGATSGLIFMVSSGTRLVDLPAESVASWVEQYPALDVEGTLARLAEWTAEKRPDKGEAWLMSWLRKKLAEEAAKTPARTERGPNGRGPSIGGPSTGSRKPAAPHDPLEGAPDWLRRRARGERAPSPMQPEKYFNIKPIDEGAPEPTDDDLPVPEA